MWRMAALALLAVAACGAPEFDPGEIDDDGSDSSSDAEAGSSDAGASRSDSGGTPTNPSTTAGLTAQQVAQKIVASGKVRPLPNAVNYYPQIVDIADGKTVPDCGIDIRILKLIFKLTEKYNSVGISDINRKCTQVMIGGGTTGSHWVNGGGGAVDFWRMNDTNLNGSNAINVEMVTYAGTFMPDGTRFGQSNCRTSAGTTVDLPGMKQFSDSCNHQHIDVSSTDAPFKD